MVEGADSVYVQNSDGDSFKAKQIYINPTYDVAVLQIIDPSFKQKVNSVIEILSAFYSACYNETRCRRAL